METVTIEMPKDYKKESPLFYSKKLAEFLSIFPDTNKAQILDIYLEDNKDVQAWLISDLKDREAIK